MDHRNARLTFLARIDLIREVEAGTSSTTLAATRQSAIDVAGAGE